MSKITIDDVTTVLDGLIESPYMFYVIVDKHGNVTSMNQNLLEALECTRDDVQGRYILDIIPDCQLPTVLRTGKWVGADICQIHGRETIVTALPIIYNGEILGALARSLFLDMSGAQVFMHRLREAEQEFSLVLETLFENPYIGFIMVNKEGFITAMNKPFLEVLALTKDEVIGQYVLDILPNSELPEVLKTGRVDKIKLWKLKDQDTLVTRMPIRRNGQVIGAIAHYFLLDMTGTQVLMDMLQETEERFTTVIEGLIESPYLAYVIVDREARITFINQTYLDIIGMKKEDVIGYPIVQVTPGSKLPEVLQTGKVFTADYWPINGRETIVNRQPIYKNEEIIGAIGHSLVLDMSGAKYLSRKLEQTEQELNLYKNEVLSIYRARWNLGDLIGESNEFARAKDMAAQCSATSSTILITGESGTGKELFAQAIHNASNRKKGPFIRINCAALPENLLESELFGYEEGAFTGAKKGGKPGKFELAKGGTIFLDEIGDMPLNMQTKLLAVLQERVVERVGGTTPIPINVRVIAATNQDLEEMVAKRELREDLYYRLNVVRLRIPPLRKRMEDLPLLVNELMRRINVNLETHVNSMDKATLQTLGSYHWPGNIRELENLLERAINLAAMNAETCLTPAHFPSLTDQGTGRISIPDNFEQGLTETVEWVEKEIIVQALMRCDGNKTRAAKLLGIHSSALYRKLEKYGLS